MLQLAFHNEHILKNKNKIVKEWIAFWNFSLCRLDIYVQRTVLHIDQSILQAHKLIL